MQDIEIMNLWKSYDQKLEEALYFNKKNVTDITKMKAASFLSSMKPLKIFTLMVGIAWVCFVDMLIINLWHTANPFFLVSAGIQVLLTTIAIGAYLYQLILLHQVDSDGPVVTIQEKIAGLKSSTLWIARLLFLQLPVWTTFYWNKSMLENGNIGLYILQAVVTISFTVAGVWLFFNIKYENRNKRWFGLIFNGKEWSPLMKSMDMLSELDEYKSKNPVK